MPVTPAEPANLLDANTLAEIARQRPRDVDALGDISGIGARKLERYGSALIGITSG